MSDLKILCVVPARGGSKGVPRKNVRDICGHPLLHYAVQAALNCDAIDKVIVSTDDDEIAAKAKECGAEVPFMRPKEIAQDAVCIIPVIAHALRYFDEKGIHYDAVFSLQPTSPFVTTDHLNEMISMMKKSDCDSVVTVTEIIHGHPYRAKKLIDGNQLESFMEGVNGDTYLQKQDLPKAYCYNGAIYLRKRDILLNYSGKDFCLGEKVNALVMSSKDSINIDTEFDFIMADSLMKEKVGATVNE